MGNLGIPEFEDIKSAHKRIENLINKTPVFTSSTLNKIFSNELFFKCENFQKVGAFKYRGASNAVSLLTNDEAKNGVATHSSGNHAAALALAATKKGIKSYIVMPDNSPGIKKKAVEGYGAEIFFCEPTLKAREETLNKVVEKTGATFIHPYNNVNVIAGQGTCALEFLNEISDLDFILAPLGGGGLLSGTLISSKAINPKIKVIGCEPKGADDAYRSFKAGKFLPSENPKSIADGLLTSLGSITYEIVMKNVFDILTVSEENIIKAMKLIWERMKIIVEPSSAVPLSCLIENELNIRNKKIGLIISGGNVDFGQILKNFSDI
jgi:threonine dehydratase